MTIRQFFAILRARWTLALPVFLSIVVIVVGLSLIWPKKYSGIASVVVDIKPDPVTAMAYPGVVSPSFMNTQVDILTSDRVTQRVIKNLRLAENPQIQAQWREATSGEGTVEGWLGDSLQKNLDVKPSRESNVITVTYKGADPRFAAGLANAYIQAYIDTTLEMRVNPARQYSTFFDQRLKEARDALEQSQSKLSAFQRANGLVATDERFDVESARLTELSTQVVALDALASESSSRQAQANGASSDKLQDVLNNALVAGLKADIARNEAKLKELNSRYGDNHPAVIEAKANHAELKARLDSEVRRVTGGVTVTNSINRQRAAEARAELEAQRAKVLKLKATRDEAQVLARDVDNAQRAYDALQARLTQSSLESQTTQSNVYALTVAQPPTEPSSPRLLLNTLLSIFIGGLLAIAAAVAREMSDRRVRSGTDIMPALGLPVLGTLPNGLKNRSALRRRSSLLEQRVLGRLPGAASKGA